MRYKTVLLKRNKTQTIVYRISVGRNYMISERISLAVLQIRLFHVGRGVKSNAFWKKNGNLQFDLVGCWLFWV